MHKTQDYGDVKAIQYDFYKEETLEESFEVLCNEIDLNISSTYFQAFKGACEKMFDERIADDKQDNKNAFEKKQKKIDRLKAIYKCILYKAGFKSSEKICFYRFSLSDDKANKADQEKWRDPVTNNLFEHGVSLERACEYFAQLNLDATANYKDDEDFKALLKVLNPTFSRAGFNHLRKFSVLHSPKGGEDYKETIDQALREGKVVLVDLSTASTQVQEKYITRLCAHIFARSMEKFTNDKAPEFIQMYFEEAHNIFPKDDKDLKNIYNRLAKEGAKLNIGISYSTQEVSSIAPSILKNTQNWFISHLNNKDELKVLEKYYDFSDFSQSIIKNNDVGFARVKTYSNNFIIPVQIDKFKDKD